MLKNKLKKRFPRLLSRGFTLYELLVSISIVAIIIGIVLYNQSRFETDIEVTNLAYRVALAVRQAQVSSISVNQFVDFTGGRFNVPHGVHFNKDVSDAFIVFADADADGLYDPEFGGSDMDCLSAEGSECVEKISIGRGNQIKGFCGISWLAGPGDVQPCTDFGVGDYQMLDIKFKRPNPDAIFKAYVPDSSDPKGSRQPYGYNSSTGEFDDGAAVTNACVNGSDNVPCDGWAICLISPKGREKRVVVYSTGQISVENVTPGSSEACDTTGP